MKRRENHSNWAELPPELTSLILLRLSTIEILHVAQKVCSSWRRVCKKTHRCGPKSMRRESQKTSKLGGSTSRTCALTPLILAVEACWRSTLRTSGAILSLPTSPIDQVILDALELLTVVNK